MASGLSIITFPQFASQVEPNHFPTSRINTSQRALRGLIIRSRGNSRNQTSCLCNRIYSYNTNDYRDKPPERRSGIQLYRDIERLLTESVKQSQYSRSSSGDWSEVEGAWVVKPRNSQPNSIAHFVGGVFVGAAPQLTYRLFLERLAEKGILVIATPYASGFDHSYIADEAQFKFDRCLRSLQESVQDLPSFGIGHSLGSVIHLLIGSRYALKRNGNILISFNNKEASSAIPLLSPVLVPMAQSIGPLLSQISSIPTVRFGAEMTLKQLENLSPSITKQMLPLVEQLSPLYLDLVNGKENFIPEPEETRKLVRSYYGIYRNFLVQFKDDTIDETPTLAELLRSGSAVSSMLDMSISMLPGDHGLPLHQALPDVPPAMLDAVNRGGDFLANLTAGMPWENVAKEAASTLGIDTRMLGVGAETGKDLDVLVDAVTSWVASNNASRPRLLSIMEKLLLGTVTRSDAIALNVFE